MAIDYELSALVVRRPGETAGLAGRRDDPGRRGVPGDGAPGPGDQGDRHRRPGAGRADRRDLRAGRGDGGRAVRIGRPSDGQRGRPAAPQQRPLDDRGRGDLAVREPRPRGPRPPARLDRPGGPACRHGERVRAARRVGPLGEAPRPHCACRARTSTSTAKRPGRAASSATSRCAGPTRPTRRTGPGTPPGSSAPRSRRRCCARPVPDERAPAAGGRRDGQLVGPRGDGGRRPRPCASSASTTRPGSCPPTAPPKRCSPSARRPPDRGLRVLIAGAGGAAHLPGMLASVTTLPVIGVPVAVGTLNGLDSLLSIVQMPKGVPVATVAVNGARNAGLLAVRILANGDPALATAMASFQDELADDGPGARTTDLPRLTELPRRGHYPRPSAMAASTERLGYGADARLLIVNADELGFCHAANVGRLRVPARRRRRPAPSLMVPCPWGREAAARYRGEDIGVHLTLNAEQELYRWGPDHPRPVAARWRRRVPGHRRGRLGPRRPRRDPPGVPGPDRAGHPVGLRREPPRRAPDHAPAAPGVLRHLPRAGPRVPAAAPHARRPSRAGCSGSPPPSWPAPRARSSATGSWRCPAVPPSSRLESTLAALAPGVTELHLRPAVDSPELRALADDWAERVGDHELLCGVPGRPAAGREGRRRGHRVPGAPRPGPVGLNGGVSRLRGPRRRGRPRSRRAGPTRLRAELVLLGGRQRLLDLGRQPEPHARGRVDLGGVGPQRLGPHVVVAGDVDGRGEHRLGGLAASAGCVRRRTVTPGRAPRTSRGSPASGPPTRPCSTSSPARSGSPSSGYAAGVARRVEGQHRDLVHPQVVGVRVAGLLLGVGRRSPGAGPDG